MVKTESDGQDGTPHLSCSYRQRWTGWTDGMRPLIPIWKRDSLSISSSGVRRIRRATRLHLSPPEAAVDPGDVLDDIKPSLSKGPHNLAPVREQYRGNQGPFFSAYWDGQGEPRRYQPGDIDLHPTSLVSSLVRFAHAGRQPPRTTQKGARCNGQLPTPTPPGPDQTDPESHRPGSHRGIHPNRLSVGIPIMAMAPRTSSCHRAEALGIRTMPRADSTGQRLAQDGGSLPVAVG